MIKVYLDTNVILRFLLGDIENQQKKAKDLMRRVELGKIQGWVSILVINELIWILENYYSIKRIDYLNLLIEFLQTKHLRILETSKINLLHVLEKLQTSTIDFTDCYLAVMSETKAQIASFDKDFARLGVKKYSF